MLLPIKMIFEPLVFFIKSGVMYFMSTYKIPLEKYSRVLKFRGIQFFLSHFFFLLLLIYLLTQDHHRRSHSQSKSRAFTFVLALCFWLKSEQISLTSSLLAKGGQRRKKEAFRSSGKNNRQNLTNSGLTNARQIFFFLFLFHFQNCNGEKKKSYSYHSIFNPLFF